MIKHKITRGSFVVCSKCSKKLKHKDACLMGEYNEFYYCSSCYNFMTSGEPYRPINSYIYFVLAPEVNRIKIGFSVKPNERYKALKTSSPVKLILLGFINGTQQEEKMLHEKFSKYRFNLEWFEYSDKIQKYVENNVLLKANSDHF